MEKSLRYFDGFRGAWLGFNRGLYKQSTWKDMESKCMDSKAKRNWIEAYSVWLGIDDLDDNVDMMTAFGDMLLLFANLTECNFRQPLSDLSTFCGTPQLKKDDDLAYPGADGEGELDHMCSFGDVLENLAKNAFVLMGKGSSMISTWKDFPSKNPDTLMVQALELGEDMGTLTRISIDF